MPKIEYTEEDLQRIVDSAITQNTTIKHMDSNIVYLVEYKKSVESSFIISIIAGFLASAGLTYALINHDVNLLFLSTALLAPAIVALYRAYSEFRSISLNGGVFNANNLKV